ncbi:MAG TPA: beta-ketoacyl synthase N-terminal-like domain-containing protein, partial [Isosphaeraceae bacterium]|nr:beta-ketoacyl synthase N-terminal-like domain-containing protein [Isosphaeraceae bacterium]
MSRRPRPLDVAIVGMACRFPGAGDLFAYWENLLAARATIGDVPADRWDASTYYDPTSTEPGRVGGRRGGYLDAPIAFDAASFGIMPRTVEGGEPEQFLVLDAARSALIDAGLLDRMPDRRRIEVVIGRGNYFNRGNLTRLQHGRVIEQTLGILRALHPEWGEPDIEAVRDDLRSCLPPFEAATIPGQLTNATAGRVADRFDLAGASYVVDAASASALVALDLGAQSLASRRADLAIVGGVYLEADVDFPMVFSRLGALSKSGDARPFSEDADGMVPGEGVGVVVLKRLRDAERDGDRVYAVVRGVGVASDGKGAGLAAPDARGHLRAIRRAYRVSGVDPTTVGLIEGHGLGVPTADRAELRALRAAFPASEGESPCVLGAASALIGHAMPAAGMAGLIKAALALYHRMLPASGVAGRPHRLLGGSSLALNPASRPWIQGAPAPRRAGVNAFGFAGINAHAVLEEHGASADGVTPGAMVRWPSEAILLGAEDRAGLLDRVRRLADRLRGRADVDLKDLACSLSADPGRVRLGLVVESVDDLIARLDAIAPRLADPSCNAIRDARGTYFWSQPLGRSGGLAFLFPGEGSQYPGMLADLCPHFPEVRTLFDTADRLALESGAIAPPSSSLFGGASVDAALWETGTAVNVVLSSQWALYQLLRRLGLNPAAVVGHSSGEFLALAAAGAVRVDRGLEERFNDLAAIFARLDPDGAVAPARLVGVAAGRERVEAEVGEYAGRVSVAVDNCPHQVVVAGPPRDVESVVARLRDRGMMVEDLPFARAYHTPAFAPLVGPVRDFFEGLEVSSPAVALYSCCSAGLVPNDPAEVRRLAIAQWTRPVEFRRTVEAMHGDGVRLFVDVGARGNLAGFVEDTLRGKPAFAVAANLPRRSGLTQLNHLVASLYAQGVALTPEFLFARRRPRLVDLDAPPANGPSSMTLQVGFPEMQLSTGVVERLRGGHDPSARVGGPAPEPAPGDEAMLSHLATMNAFLQTQRAVMGGLLAGGPIEADEPSFAPIGATPSRNGFHPSAGPWAGEVRRIDPGREVEAAVTLEAPGDPVAEHHTFGGRRVSSVDPSMKGLPVLPFTVMAEMLAQVAARLAPGKALVGLRDVRARRWIRYEDGPIPLEIVAKSDAENPGHIRASLFNRGRAGLGDSPEVEATIVFDECRAEPPFGAATALERPEPSRFTAHSMYAEQWLFHGPALRAVAEVGEVSARGIDGTLRVLPRGGLYRDPSSPMPLTDPIVLDAFTHLLGLWGLERLAEGDVIFPLRLGRLDVFGGDPPEGSDCPCRIRIKAVERTRVAVDAEILRPDGRVWMRLTDWEDWRFYWPPRYRDVFRSPENVLVGEPLDLAGEGGAVAVWLEPPADMGRPVWRDVLEQIQLSPEERAGCLKPTGHDGRRTLRLWGRIAAKEAARRLWSAAGGSPIFPADLTIEPDAKGRPVLRSRARPDEAMPAVSIAHTAGVAVAIAAHDPAARVGIDVEKVVDRAATFEAMAFSPRERALLDRLPRGARAEWIARFWTAKEAAAKATGLALIAGPSSVEVVAADEEGRIGVVLRDELATSCLDLAEPLHVRTDRRGEYVWAWTLAGAPCTRIGSSLYVPPRETGETWEGA